MPDLTDSYCERCGARYIFSPPAPKNLSLKGARVLAKGLKNFVLNDGQSMTDSLALARNEDEHQDSSRITEAFHRTFNFCMTCRQYACDQCWNVKTGACLSCSPEADFDPIAPEDHMIVRTPVARWDSDWSLFPDGPAVEPFARPTPMPFDEPIRFSDPAPEQPAQPAAWPLMDLPNDRTAQPTAGIKSGHRSTSKKVDAEAASLWPIADEIAPEMTLTPEELELVESRLGQGDAPEEVATFRRYVPEPVHDNAPPAPATPRRADAEDVARPPEWTEVARGPRTTSVPAWVAKNVEPGYQSAAASIEAEEPVAARPDAVIPTGRILRMPLASPPAPPLGSPPMSQPAPTTPPSYAPEPAHQHNPFVERLLGKHEPQADAMESPRPSRADSHATQPTGDLWPHATRWAERVVEVHDYWAEIDAAAAAVVQERVLPPVPAMAATAQPAPAPEPVPQPAWISPVPPHPVSANVDARSAAAVRLPTIGTTDSFTPAPAETPAWAAAQAEPLIPEPAPVPPAAPIRQRQSERTGQTPLFELPLEGQAPRPAATPEPTWDEIDPDVAEAVRGLSSSDTGGAQSQPPADAAPTPQLPSRPQTPRPTPPGQWPPLGSSWSATDAPKAPWPAPEAPSVLSVVAAQRAGAPTVTEMWAQSSEEVLNRGTVRVCHRCALPVSTQARYCRRCGTQQS